MAANAGKYRQRVTIQQDTPTTNAAGQPVSVWSTYAVRWLQIEAVSGREIVRGKQRRAEISHVLACRADPLTRAITPRMRVLWGSRKLNLVSAYDPNGRRIEIEMEATEDTT